MMLPPVPAARQPRKWTAEEDRMLREEVEAQKRLSRTSASYIVGHCAHLTQRLTSFPENGGQVKDWCAVAAKLPGRTNKDCRKRWLNSVAEGLKKGQWARSEDEQLFRGVERHGTKWTVSVSLIAPLRAVDHIDTSPSLSPKR